LLFFLSLLYQRRQLRCCKEEEPGYKNSVKEITAYAISKKRINLRKVVDK